MDYVSKISGPDETLKAKIDSAIIAGKAEAPNGRFWVSYQFEVRPGVAVDFEIVDSAGGIYMSMRLQTFLSRNLAEIGNRTLPQQRRCRCYLPDSHRGNGKGHRTVNFSLSVAVNRAEKQAVIAIGRRPKDEAVPILIRTARNHPKMAVRKLAIQVLGQTGDERAVAFFRELLSKD